MIKLTLRVLAVSALMISASSAQPGIFDLVDLSGAELFSRFCASCHGESGRGDGPVASTLSAVVPDLTQISERYGEFSATDIREIIDGRSPVVAHGSRMMPVWGYEFWIEEGADIAAEREARIVIDRLVEHLSSIQGSTFPPEGQQTFMTYCASCHGVRGEGDGPAASAMRVTVPNLRTLSERNGGDFPAQIVAGFIDGRMVPAAHGERYMPVWGEVFATTEGGALADAQLRIDALVDFLRGIQYAD